jgi:hypothetical protein
MRVHEVSPAVSPDGLEREIRAVASSSPPDVVLQLRIPVALAGAAALRAARLRALCPTSANVTVAMRR